jgi:hypothetical protein
MPNPSEMLFSWGAKVAGENKNSILKVKYIGEGKEISSITLSCSPAGGSCEKNLGPAGGPTQATSPEILNLTTLPPAPVQW